MLRKPAKLLLALAVLTAASATPPLFSPVGGNEAHAQDKRGRGVGSLSNLQKNPKYRGRVLGTHVFRTGPDRDSYLYEVRILTPDDRVILVYVDPATGQVVRDTAGQR
ncbi:MAG: hypothetical protein OEY85_10140 [Rhodospirillales bacterium]|nr:hypothetical protein [Rhodospirillales bacterium]